MMRCFICNETVEEGSIVHPSGTLRAPLEHTGPCGLVCEGSKGALLAQKLPVPEQMHTRRCAACAFDEEETAP